ncbi:MAG TPA: hypothetical protein VNE58_01440, partial [Casimicrobiaceae bacterium]|nr:hypothetical protein [Casimicrobiaceae bacterium]
YLAIAYFLVDRHRDALTLADASLTRAPHHVALNAMRAAALSRLGNGDEARRAAGQVLRLSPVFEIENFGTRLTPQHTAKLQDALREAGL